MDINELKEKLNMETGSLRLRSVELLDTVNSTNDYLKEASKENITEGKVAVALCQTAGKGRIGRRFYSDRGKGIYLSYLTVPKGKIEDIYKITARAAVAAAEAVQTACGLKARIKWVNDLVYDGKKLCGILTETASGSDGEINRIIIGIGINVYKSDYNDEIKDIAGAVEEFVEAKPDFAKLCAELIKGLDRLCRNPKSDRYYRRRYKKLCGTIKQNVTVIQGEKSYKAYVLGIDRNFNLIVKTEKGEKLKVCGGEVSITR